MSPYEYRYINCVKYVVKYLQKKTLTIKNDASWQGHSKDTRPGYKGLFLSFELVHWVLKMSGSGGKVWIEGRFKEGQISFSLCPNVLSFLEFPINYNYYLNSNLTFISDWRILGLHLVQKSIYFRENNNSDWSHQRFFFKILMYILHINSYLKQWSHQSFF